MRTSSAARKRLKPRCFSTNSRAKRVVHGGSTSLPTVFKPRNSSAVTDCLMEVLTRELQSISLSRILRATFTSISVRHAQSRRSSSGRNGADAHKLTIVETPARNSLPATSLPNLSDGSSRDNGQRQNRLAPCPSEKQAEKRINRFVYFYYFSFADVSLAFFSSLLLKLAMASLLEAAIPGFFTRLLPRTTSKIFLHKDPQSPQVYNAIRSNHLCLPFATDCRLSTDKWFLCVTFAPTPSLLPGTPNHVNTYETDARIPIPRGLQPCTPAGIGFLRLAEHSKKKVRLDAGAFREHWGHILSGHHGDLPCRALLLGSISPLNQLGEGISRRSQRTRDQIVTGCAGGQPAENADGFTVVERALSRFLQKPGGHLRLGNRGQLGVFFART